MCDRDQINSFRRTNVTRVAFLTCFWVLANSSPAVAETVFNEPFEPFVPTEEINSTYSLYVAMTQGLEHAFAGVDSLTRVVEFKDLGMGQEIVQRCEVSPGTPICDEMDPLKLQALEAEGKSGKSSADLAQILGDAADGSFAAGIMLEMGIAREMGVAPTVLGEVAAVISTDSDNDQFGENPLERRCAAADSVNAARTGSLIDETTTTYQRDLLPTGLEAMRESYFSPIGMMTEASCMLLVAAKSLTDAQGRDGFETASSAEMMAAVEQVLFHGVEEVENGPAYRLSLDNPGLIEEIDGGPQFQVDKIERWIHVDYLTDFKTRISGTLTDRGETRALFIEKELGDFRWLPGTQRQHPFRTTNRVGGIFSEEQLEEMSEATESLDEIEQQMAAMSPAQRQQMEQMMGSRINQLRNMVDSGVFEFTQITKRVLVNADAREALSGNVGYEPELLTQEIQSNLKLLGYDPGEIDGELSRETIVAIVRFERDYQLAPTGRPTPQLARIISATLSAIR
jgi:hypothetical protein